jgi:pyruvate, water dikinase
MTDPDWVPVMKRASAIITEEGGRTCHAAIVARELGIPAVVGATHALTLKAGAEVTVSCAEGEHGVIYEGKLPFTSEDVDISHLPKTRTRVMINLASPDAAYRCWRLPISGVGLARTEFIVSDAIRIHPMALLHPERVLSRRERRKIADLTRGHASGREYFVDRLALGIARLASSQYPKRVIVRTSDFKTNEYAGLIGGRWFEPHEQNPMIGFRGASRYTHERYREAFVLECEAFHRVREQIGLTNVHVMIPFVRTLKEADAVLALLRECGLERGDGGLEIYAMCEVPSTAILARELADRFDGLSIGSNDLTQLVLGVDRDSTLLAIDTFDENNDAVKWCIERTIARVHAGGGVVGLCGQAPSDDPAFAAFLVEAGIDSISLDPDSVVPVIRRIAEVEAAIARRDQALPPSPTTGADGSALSHR